MENIISEIRKGKGDIPKIYVIAKVIFARKSSVVISSNIEERKPASKERVIRRIKGFPLLYLITFRAKYWNIPLSFAIIVKIIIPMIIPNLLKSI